MFLVSPRDREHPIGQRCVFSCPFSVVLFSHFYLLRLILIFLALILGFKKRILNVLVTFSYVRFYIYRGGTQLCSALLYCYSIHFRDFLKTCGFRKNKEGKDGICARLLPFLWHLDYRKNVLMLRKSFFQSIQLRSVCLLTNRVKKRMVHKPTSLDFEIQCRGCHVLSSLFTCYDTRVISRRKCCVIMNPQSRKCNEFKSKYLWK